MEQIPLTVLSGILIKIGFDIIDMKILKVIKYAPKDDLYVLLVVFYLVGRGVYDGWQAEENAPEVVEVVEQVQETATGQQQ